MSVAKSDKKGSEKRKNRSKKNGKVYGLRQDKRGIVFTAYYPAAAVVQVAGEFNNWQPDRTPMQRVDDTGVWRVKLPLTSGRYCYRFVVDGQWQQDPYNELTELNPYGELNSVLQVS